MFQAQINNDINYEKAKGRDHNLYPLPNKLFSIIYADPPWDYGGKWQYSRPISGRGRSAEITSAAQWKYPTMTLQALKQIPVYQISKDDCLLFLWATSPMLQKSIDLGTSWGFGYSTVAFVWDKQIHNPGRYTLSQSELCLVFKKGKIPSPRGAKNIKQYISVKRGQHSEKPIEVRDRITKMFPSLAKIELFARPSLLDKSNDNWCFWGNEINARDELSKRDKWQTIAGRGGRSADDCFQF